MIVCKLELWPGGVEKAARPLGQIEITNDFLTSIRSDGSRGTYLIKLFKKRQAKFWKTKVCDFPRQSYHPWNIVRIALNQIAEKNGGRI